MPVRIELTYDMGKLLGTQQVEVEAGSVAEAIAAARARFGEGGGDFDQLAKRTAIAVNGVLARHRERLATKLSEGDTVSFVKAAAGG
ncbi:MAG: hypothetical protein CL910_08000 [Deltaproteobacteria bacterium]|nr:hypothetical protein [Deltaproteobacteria bacterium]